MTQQARDDKYVLDALRKGKPSVAHSTTVTDSIVSIVKEGRVPEGGKL